MRSMTFARVALLGLLVVCAGLTTSSMLRSSALSAQSITQDHVQREGESTPIIFTSKLGMLKTTVTQVHGITRVAARAIVQSREPEATCVWSVILKDGDGDVISHEYFDETSFKLGEKSNKNGDLYKIEPEFSRALPLQPGKYSFGVRIHYLPKGYDPERVDEYSYVEGYCLAVIE